MMATRFAAAAVAVAAAVVVAVAALLLPPREPPAKLSRVESCQRFYDTVGDRFYDTVGDLSMSDAQWAVAFSALARQTADPALAAAIERVADGFARGAPSISSTEVQALCP